MGQNQFKKSGKNGAKKGFICKKWGKTYSKIGQKMGQKLEK
jgi:hypothetical protein